MQRPKKHHYIPIFYLKRWAAGDGRVCEFSQPHGAVVRPRRVHPSGTGYMKGLYTLAGLPTQIAQYAEEKFFTPADTAAAEALELFYQRDHTSWNVRLKSGWSRFVVSLLLRTPEEVDRIKEIMREDVRVKDEADYQYIDRVSVQVLTELVDNEAVGQHVNRMLWRTIDTPGAAYEFLTSDRPVIQTNGLSDADSYLICPIGPRKLFVACNRQETLAHLTARGVDGLVGDVNNTVAAFAVKYVWGRDDRQLRFVQNRMSAKSPPSLLAAIQERQKTRRDNERLADAGERVSPKTF